MDSIGTMMLVLCCPPNGMAPPGEGDSFILESGADLLLEDGASTLLLE